VRVIAARVASFVEPSSNKASPSQPCTDSKRERREIISWANVSIHGLLYTLVLISATLLN
jgi:hypothetical protein